jgi:CheY-like chemotaxis protein
MKSILIVDDNPAHALLTREAFKEFFEVDEMIHFRESRKALDYLYYRNEFENRIRRKPFMILLDLNMPQISGLEMLEIIKGDEQLKTIPVIMLTLSENDADADACYRKGADAFVFKQFNYDDYKEEIRALGEFWGFTNSSPSI